MSEAQLPETDEVLPQGTEDEVSPTDDVAPPASEETEESSETETTDEAPAEPEVKKPVTGFQKRIQKFQAALSQREQELEYWKSVALQGKQTEPEVQAPAKPKLSDFDNVDDYFEAREAFLRAELLAEAQEAAVKQARTAQHQTSVVAQYEQKVREAASSLPDWQEVMEAAADEPTAPETVQFCLDSDIGPRIAYHLAKHPDEHERINSLSPMRRVAELGKLEASLKAPAAARPSRT